MAPRAILAKLPEPEMATDEFKRFDDIRGPKPPEFIGFGDIHGPKPYEFIGFGDIHGLRT